MRFGYHQKNSVKILPSENVDQPTRGRKPNNVTTSTTP